MIRPSFRPRLLLAIAIISTTMVLTLGTSSAEETSKPRHSYNTIYVYFTEPHTEPPVLSYHCSGGHHGQWISDSDIERIYIWKDGNIAWKVAPAKNNDGRFRFNIHWFQTTIPAEKVEAAVQEIMVDFAKYPTKMRPLESRISFAVDSNSSPSVQVASSQLYSYMWIDHFWWKFYKENQEIFRGNDKEAILKTIKAVDRRGGYKGLVNS